MVVQQATRFSDRCVRSNSDELPRHDVRDLALVELQRCGRFLVLSDHNIQPRRAFLALFAQKIALAENTDDAVCRIEYRQSADAMFKHQFGRGE